MASTVHTQLAGLGYLRRAVRRGGFYKTIGERAYRRAARHYFTFLYRRYKRAAKSPGNPWVKLEKSTIDKKKSQRRGRRGPWSPSAILVDTTKLINAFNPRTMNHKAKRIQLLKRGGEVGIGIKKGVSHSRRVTYAWLVGYHANLKNRRIVVLPDNRTRAAMTKEIQKGINDIAKRANRGGR